MLTARLTPEELEAVTARAEREGMTRSELVREALRRHLEETKGPAE
jgi:metal-responsive CopG/Arc/MetJ family transcriptional regulator